MTTQATAEHPLPPDDEARRLQGLQIAQRVHIARRPDGTYLVPASSRGRKYSVTMDAAGNERCNCPDFGLRGKRCKHGWSVYWQRQGAAMSNGNEGKVLTSRPTYQQDWTNYNLAQMNEGEIVPRLLRELCNGIPETEQTMGRPRFPLSETIFAAVMKVFGLMSGRRSDDAMRRYKKSGLLAKKPHFNTVLRVLNDPAATEVLTHLIEESAAALSPLESVFAADSSGFNPKVYRRWFDHKWRKPKRNTEQRDQNEGGDGVVQDNQENGREWKEATWIKAHIMIGVNTHVVTAIRIGEEDSADSPELGHLLATTAQRFDIKEVCADKAYLSEASATAISGLGAYPYIPFKVNSNGRGSPGHANREGGELWRKLFYFFSFHREEFLAHYHQRSNVETCFAMVKRKFDHGLRAKNPVAQRNELLCKFLAHNLCCLNSAIHELGVEPKFFTDGPLAPITRTLRPKRAHVERKPRGTVPPKNKRAPGWTMIELPDVVPANDCLELPEPPTGGAP